jgi:uncharacterized protein
MNHTPKTDRITSLDTIRGIAVLGILLINIVYFFLGDAACYNISASGITGPLDWVVGALGEVFAQQKFMGIFSLLFGTSVVLFANRAEAKGKSAINFSLRRFGWLFIIGLIHVAFSEVDILVVYALCAPIVLLLRNQPPTRLIIFGVALVLSMSVAAILTQATVGPMGDGLGYVWFSDASADDTALPVASFEVADFFLRALGMMLIGAAFYRLGIVTGERSVAWYRRAAVIGIGLGLPLTVAGTVWMFATNFSPSVALVGSIPNRLATIPIVVGYISLIVLWDHANTTWMHRRIRAVGRMALTNYLMQTALVLTFMSAGFEGPYSRSELLVLVLGVWALQLTWSEPWLKYYRFGPMEWIWRLATYGQWLPNRLSQPV